MVEYQPAKIDPVTPPLGCFGVFFSFVLHYLPSTPLHRFLFPSVQLSRRCNSYFVNRKRKIEPKKPQASQAGQRLEVMGARKNAARQGDTRTRSF